MALVTIETRHLINIIDELTSAQIETHAIYLMGNALQRDDTDAFQMLATNVNDSIELAKQSIEKLRIVEEGPANG